MDLVDAVDDRKKLAIDSSRWLKGAAQGPILEFQKERLRETTGLLDELSYVFGGRVQRSSRIEEIDESEELRFSTRYAAQRALDTLCRLYRRQKTSTPQDCIDMLMEYKKDVECVIRGVGLMRQRAWASGEFFLEYSKNLR